ncbi:MAG TPA: polysaccharide deacetylase family protein [Solirubrobacterales bacterium]|nr:polysaccharide deacetylase family protein [Solirubrobacterales bacterium]
MNSTRPRVVVLCYHALSDSWPDETAVTPARFAEQVEAFLRRGYLGSTFTDALTAPAAPRTLVVTFDDAAESVHRLAAPLLEELGLPATVFVPTDYPASGEPMSWDGLDRWVGGPHERELECMGWDRLGDLAARGWEIGSHTRSHPLLSRLGDADLERELLGSKQDCEQHLGGHCTSLAYPYGVADARVAHAARAAGYLAAATVPVSPTPPLPMLWPRVGAYRGDSARRLMLRARRRAFGASAMRL